MMPSHSKAIAAQSMPSTAQTNKDMQTEADKVAEELRKRARKAGGRQSTILTSPLGVIESAPSIVKTLLGS